MGGALNSPLEEFQGRPSFHLAFSVRDLDEARAFYVDVLGCSVGRSAENWMDFNFFGFQITAHLASDVSTQSNPVDDHDIPVPHFGLIMDSAFSRTFGLREKLASKQRFSYQILAVTVLSSRHSNNLPTFSTLKSRQYSKKKLFEHFAGIWRSHERFAH